MIRLLTCLALLAISLLPGKLLADGLPQEYVTFYDPTSDDGTKSMQMELLTYRHDIGMGLSMTIQQSPSVRGNRYYYAKDSYTYEDRFYIEDNAVLTLVVAKNVKLEFKKGIHIKAGGTLKIYSVANHEKIKSIGDMYFHNSTEIIRRELGYIQCTGYADDYQALIQLDERAHLYVYGTWIEAWGGASNYGAGIGSCSEGGNNWDIVIYDGIVAGQGGYEAAGIGGGWHRYGSSITINGGFVKAWGGKWAAGIGGGYEDHCGKLTINGGTVWAMGGDGSAGIGGACYGGTGVVTINGGSVVAHGGTGGAYGCGAGIGTGNSPNSAHQNEITINGGEVTAFGGEGGAGGGAGIGWGDDGNAGDNNGNSMNININGGMLDIKAGDHSSAIGGGDNAGNTKIKITGGCVSAYINDDPGDSMDIGRGNDSGEYSISIGGDDGLPIIYAKTIQGLSEGHEFIWFQGKKDSTPLIGTFHWTANPSDTQRRTAKLNLGKPSKNGELVSCNFKQSDALRIPSYTSLIIPEYTSLSSTDYAYIDLTNDGASLIVGSEDADTHDYDTALSSAIISRTVSRRIQAIYNLSEHARPTDPQSHYDISKNDLTIPFESLSDYKLPSSVSVKVNGEFLEQGEIGERCKYFYTNTFDNVTYKSSGSVTINNYALNGNVEIIVKCKFRGETLPDGTVILKPGMDTLESDDYVITNSFERGAIKVIGYVRILSAPGTVFTTHGGIQLEDNAHLTIDGYNGPAGTINAYGGHEDNENPRPGINVPSTSSLKIYDGSINAVGERYAAGIGSEANKTAGTMTFAGGNIKATGGEQAAGIGGGRTADCGTIHISSQSNKVNVVAIGGAGAAGIGGGATGVTGASTGTSGKIIIESGVVEAYGSAEIAGAKTFGIGSNDGGRTSVDFSTGTNGTAIIHTTAMNVKDSEKISKDWGAVIFESENGGGRVYGTVVLQDDLEIKNGETLEIGPRDSLIVGEDGKKITGYGTIDLSAGGDLQTYDNSSVASTIKIIYPGIIDLFDSNEKRISFTQQAEIESYKLWNQCRTETGIKPEVVRLRDYDSRASYPKPIKGLNDVVDKWHRYFTDYLTYEQGANPGEMNIVNGKPNFMISSLSVDGDYINCTVKVERAKFREGTKIRVHGFEKPGLSEIRDAYSPIGEVDIEIQGDASTFSFAVEKPEKYKFFKAVIIPATF